MLDKTDKINHKKQKISQSEVVEEYLTGILDNLCTCLNMRLSDWDLDKKLLEAMLKNTKIKSNAAVCNMAAYDACYESAKKLTIKVNSNFKWFTNITTLIKNN